MPSDNNFLRSTEAIGDKNELTKQLAKASEAKKAAESKYSALASEHEGTTLRLLFFCLASVLTHRLCMQLSRHPVYRR